MGWQSVKHVIMRIVIAVLAILVSVGTAAQNKTLTFSDSLMTYNVALDSSMSGRYSQCNVKSITVSKTADNALVQSLELADNIISCEWLRHEFFVVEDMNFDGKNDFRMLLSLSPGGNKSYAYWLYNSSTKAFEQSHAYEDSLVTVRFDQDKKLVKSYWSGGTEYGSETYKVSKGKLQLVEREMIAPEESATGYYIRSVYKLTGGVMKRAEKERISEEQLQQAIHGIYD